MCQLRHSPLFTDHCFCNVSFRLVALKGDRSYNKPTVLFEKSRSKLSCILHEPDMSQHNTTSRLHIWLNKFCVVVNSDSFITPCWSIFIVQCRPISDEISVVLPQRRKKVKVFVVF